MSLKLEIALVILFFSVSAKAGPPPLESQENLGEVFIDEILVSPVFKVDQNDFSSFELGTSLMRSGWRASRNFSAYLAFGENSLRGQPSRFGSQSDANGFGIIEGYGLFNGALGEVRFGLQPLIFGFESGGSESRLRFSRSLLFREDYVGLRDFGVSYAIDNGGFYTQMLVHNGESGTEIDERVWFTTHFGFNGWLGYDFRLSLTTGETSPESSAQAETPSTLTVFNINEVADWRIGMLSHKGVSKRTAWQIEVYSGRVEQTSQANSFWGGHIDIIYHLTKNGYLGFRYDYFEPDDSTENNERQDLVFLVEYDQVFQSSRWILEWRTVMDKGSTGRANQLLLTWRLTSRLVAWH